MSEDNDVSIKAASFITGWGSDGDWIINENEGIVHNPNFKQR
jgi:hypothetical protein